MPINRIIPHGHHFRDGGCSGAGALVHPSGPDGSLVCPDCGAVVETGWWDSAIHGVTEQVPWHPTQGADDA